MDRAVSFCASPGASLHMDLAASAPFPSQGEDRSPRRHPGEPVHLGVLLRSAFQQAPQGGRGALGTLVELFDVSSSAMAPTIREGQSVRKVRPGCIGVVHVADEPRPILLHDVGDEVQIVQLSRAHWTRRAAPERSVLAMPPDHDVGPVLLTDPSCPSVRGNAVALCVPIERF